MVGKNREKRDKERASDPRLLSVVAPSTAVDMCVSVAAAVGSPFGGEALLKLGTQQC